MSGTIDFNSTVVTPAVVFHNDDEKTALRVPVGATTLAGFRSWAASDEFPQRGEIAFIEGEVAVDMSPENFDLHNFLKGEISSTLRIVIRENDLGRLFYDRCYMTNERAQLSTEPDAMFLSHESRKRQKASFVKSSSSPGGYIELVGAPDWVLEVVSQSSLKKDKEVLRRAYYRAGVQEYWIADALGSDVELTMLVRGKRGFVAVRPRGGWYPSPTFGYSFQLSREKAIDGLWDYTLNYKSVE